MVSPVGDREAGAAQPPVHGQEPRCAQHRLPVPLEQQMWQVSGSQQ